MLGDGLGEVRAADATHGVGEAVGEVLGEGDGDAAGEGEWDAAADGDGEGLGVGVKHARRALVDVFGVTTATGPGPRPARYRATGTTIMPTTTVSTKVTAPHSLLMNAQLTRREV